MAENTDRYVEKIQLSETVEHLVEFVKNQDAATASIYKSYVDNAVAELSQQFAASTTDILAMLQEIKDTTLQINNRLTVQESAQEDDEWEEV